MVIESLPLTTPHLPQIECREDDATTLSLHETVGPFLIPTDAWCVTGASLCLLGSFERNASDHEDGERSKQAFQAKASLDFVWWVKEVLDKKMGELDPQSKSRLVMQAIPKQGTSEEEVMSIVSQPSPCFMPYDKIGAWAFWVEFSAHGEDGDEIRRGLDAHLESLLAFNQSSQDKAVLANSRLLVEYSHSNERLFNLSVNSRPLTQLIRNRVFVCEMFAKLCLLPSDHFLAGFDETQAFDAATSTVSVKSLFAPFFDDSNRWSERLKQHTPRVLERAVDLDTRTLDLSNPMVFRISNAVSTHKDLVRSLFPSFGNLFKRSHIVLGHSPLYKDANERGTPHSWFALCRQVIEEKTRQLADRRTQKTFFLPFIASCFSPAACSTRGSKAALATSRYIQRARNGERSEHRIDHMIGLHPGFDASASIIRSLFLQAEDLFGVWVNHSAFILAFLTLRQCGMRHIGLSMNIIVSGAAGVGKSHFIEIAKSCTPSEHMVVSSHDSSQAMLTEPNHEEDTCANFTLINDELHASKFGAQDIEKRAPGTKETGDTSSFCSLLKDCLSSKFISYRRNIEQTIDGRKTRKIQESQQRSNFAIIACSNHCSSQFPDALQRRLAFMTVPLWSRADGQTLEGCSEKAFQDNPNLKAEYTAIAQQLQEQHKNDAHEMFLCFHAMEIGCIRPVEMSAWVAVSERFRKEAKHHFEMVHSQTRVGKQCANIAEVITVLRAITLVRRSVKSPFAVKKDKPLDLNFIFEVEKHLVCSEQDCWLAISLAEEILFPVTARVVLKGIRSLYEKSLNNPDLDTWKVVDTHNHITAYELVTDDGEADDEKEVNNVTDHVETKQTKGSSAAHGKGNATSSNRADDKAAAATAANAARNDDEGGIPQPRSQKVAVATAGLYLAVEDSRVKVAAMRDPFREYTNVFRALINKMADVTTQKGFGGFDLDSQSFLHSQLLELMQSRRNGKRSAILVVERDNNGEATACLGVQISLVTRAGTLESPIGHIFRQCRHMHSTVGNVLFGHAIKRTVGVRGAAPSAKESGQLQFLPQYPDFETVGRHDASCSIFRRTVLPAPLRRKLLENNNEPDHDLAFLKYTVRDVMQMYELDSSGLTEALLDSKLIGDPEASLKPNDRQRNFAQGVFVDSGKPPEKGFCNCFRSRPLTTRTHTNAEVTAKSIALLQGSPTVQQQAEQADRFIRQNLTDIALQKHFEDIGIDENGPAPAEYGDSTLTNRDLYHPTLNVAFFREDECVQQPFVQDPLLKSILDSALKPQNLKAIGSGEKRKRDIGVEK